MRHSCGLVGICADRDINIPKTLFFPLFSLQHRGQESCGISYLRRNQIVTYKDLGMVSQVLSRYLAEDHPSHLGIGHVRYSTQGGSRIENAQPITINSNKGQISLVHNGTISNSGSLREELFADGSIFQTTTDSELILHLLSRSRKRNFLDALKETLERLQGAYNLLILHEGRLIALRDPMGFRPLVMGTGDDMTVFASETCALAILQIDHWREVEPGELVVVDRRGVTTDRFADSQKKSYCIFELIYFARPDSSVFRHSVYSAREKMGGYLADSDHGSYDVVIPVPDSGNCAALGYANRSGIPLRFGLTRNHYTGRTFIQPTSQSRELGVRMKLHPVTDAIKDQRIILMDDSLVRGTTSRLIVKLLRDAGAREIHLRLSAPEIRFPCYYGIDIPTEEELISHRMDPNTVAKHIGADSVRFLPMEKLARCVDRSEDFCFSCFHGRYPFESSQIPLDFQQRIVPDSE